MYTGTSGVSSPLLLGETRLEKWGRCHVIARKVFQIAVLKFKVRKQRLLYLMEFRSWSGNEEHLTCLERPDDSEAYPTLYSEGTGFFLPGVNLPGHEVDHSPSSSA